MSNVYYFNIICQSLHIEFHTYVVRSCEFRSKFDPLQLDIVVTYGSHVRYVNNIAMCYLLHYNVPLLIICDFDFAWIKRYINKLFRIILQDITKLFKHLLHCFNWTLLFHELKGYTLSIRNYSFTRLQKEH